MGYFVRIVSGWSVPRQHKIESENNTKNIENNIMKELHDKKFANLKNLNDILSLDKTLPGWLVLTILVRQFIMRSMTWTVILLSFRS